MKVCELDPSTDTVTNICICSKHFQAEDYYKPFVSSIKYKLKAGAIPSKEIVNAFGAGSCDLPSTSYNGKI